MMANWCFHGAGELVGFFPINHFPCLHDSVVAYFDSLAHNWRVLSGQVTQLRARFVSHRGNWQAELLFDHDLVWRRLLPEFQFLSPIERCVPSTAIISQTGVVI